MLKTISGSESQSQLSPLQLEVIGADLTYTVREMRNTMIRMAYSPIITETHDMACALTNADGEIVAVNHDLPVHTFCLRYAVSTVYERYGNRIAPGDQFFVNDPYQVGTHLNDSMVLAPFFRDGKIIMWIGCTVHYGDVGGTAPGSASGESTSIFHEGIRVPLVKIVEGGNLHQEFLTVLLANSRQPFEIEGVFSAQSICLKLAEKRLHASCDRFGASVIEEAIERLLAGSERYARDAIRALPDGKYYSEDYLENGGPNSPDPVRVVCEMTIDGDSLKFDFTGSSRQVEGVTNASLPETSAGVFEIVDTYLSPGQISNFGAMRAIEVTAPPGTVVNSQFPAAVAGWATISFGPVHGCVIGCLAQVMPENVSALTSCSANQTNVAGKLKSKRDSDEIWLAYEYPPGGWGATKDTDGSLMCWQFHLGDIPSLWPVERLESLNPVRAHFNKLYVDSGGPGMRRGGPGIIRGFEVRSEGEFSVVGTDAILPRPGMCGGYAGALNWISIIRDGAVIKTADLPLKVGGFKLLPGDMVLYLVSGGGGYGDPILRPVEEVLADVEAGYVSVVGAQEDYGVVIVDGAVDEEATARRRATICDSRFVVEVVEAESDHYDAADRRRMRLSPEFASKLGVSTDDIVEYVNPKGAHLRAWVTVDETLDGAASPMGPMGRAICQAQTGDRIVVRTPHTHAMRRQSLDLNDHRPWSN